jgi:hypothetical protein
MNQNSNLNQFDKYLDGKSEISQLYADLPEADFPNHLDAAILAEAHRAVNSHPNSKPKRRWAIPLGMVATLFVAVMVGVQVPYMLKDAAAPQQYKEEKIAAMMDKALSERSMDAPDKRKKTNEAAQLMARTKPAVSVMEPTTISAEAEAPATTNSPVPAAPAELAAQPAAKTVKPLQLKDAADADKGYALAKEKKSAGKAADSLSDVLEQRAPAAASVAAPAPERLRKSLMQPLKEEVSDTPISPEVLLLRIRRLKEEGRLEEAKKELAEFKKRYPDYQVPMELEFK